MDITFHYPPELLELLVDTVPRLVKSKQSVLLFLQGAGVDISLLREMEQQLNRSPADTTKYKIVRTVLTRLNERGESSLRARREIIRRVTEFEDFSTCYDNDRLKAKGLVAEVRRVVDVKDSFTRMRQEADTARKGNIAKREKEQAAAVERAKALESVKNELEQLFFETNAQRRGKALEPVLNRLFQVNDISVREDFTLRGWNDEGVIEQIDGVIELDGHLYLVEMKWTKAKLDPKDVGQHLVRVFSRGHARGFFISAGGYTDAAVISCKESLRQSVIALATLHEIVELLRRQTDFREFLKAKVNAAILDKNPLHDVLGIL